MACNQTLIRNSAALLSAFLAVPLAAQSNLLQNSGFEQHTSTSPSNWSIDNRTTGGTVSVASTGKRGGSYALTLSLPSAAQGSLSAQLGAGQALTAAAVKGQTLYVSGWLSAAGQATAVLTALAYRSDGNAYLVQLRQGTAATPTLVKDKLAIPNDPLVMFVVVLCQLEGTGAAYFDDLSVTVTKPVDWDASLMSGNAALGGLTAQVTVDAASVVRTAPPTVFGQNLEWMWSGNGAWDPAANRTNPEVVRLTKEMSSKILRFPGGIMADYYDWRKAVGPLGQRIPMAPVPGSSPEMPFFGTDEAMRFAAESGAELLITVNAGSGTPEMAAEWVKYANRSGLKVRYWEVGNELYAKSGAMFAPVTMDPASYARKYLAFAKAMRAADPRIKIGAIACESVSTMDCTTYPGWTEIVLRNAGNEIDFLSVHNAYAPGVDGDMTTSTTDVYMAMMAAPQHIRRSMDYLQRKVEVFAPARAGKIRLAVTEWGPYFSSDGSSRFAEHGKTMASAIYVASVLKVFAESKTTDVATAFQLLDGLFTGWIGQRNGVLTPKPSYYVQQMFARHFTGQIVTTSTVSPTFNTGSIGSVPASTGVSYVEALASKSADGKTLYVALWNKNPMAAISVNCSLRNFTAAAKVSTWSLTGTAADAHTGTQPLPGVYTVPQAIMEGNSAFNSGTTSRVTMPSGSLSTTANEVSVTLQPMSLTLVTIPKL